MYLKIELLVFYIDLIHFLVTVIAPILYRILVSFFQHLQNVKLNMVHNESTHSRFSILEKCWLQNKADNLPIDHHQGFQGIVIEVKQDE